MSYEFDLPLIAKPIRTKYMRPGDDFLKIIMNSIADDCEDGDIIAISEKAISVAMGRVLDESRVRPSLMAKALARIWMRLIWGYLLGRLCHLTNKTIWRLKRYPIPEGEAHKEIVLRYVGFSQSLLYYSEGGLDVTNLPYALASLPLSSPEEVADRVLTAIEDRCCKEISVMLVDSDKTYSGHGLHLASRPTATGGI